MFYPALPLLARVYFQVASFLISLDAYPKATQDYARTFLSREHMVLVVLRQFDSDLLV
jgi:hypothetical protein